MSVMPGSIRMAIKSALREAFRYGAIWADRDKSLDEPRNQSGEQAFDIWYGSCDPMLGIRQAESNNRNARLRRFADEVLKMGAHDVHGPTD